MNAALSAQLSRVILAHQIQERMIEEGRFDLALGYRTGSVIRFPSSDLPEPTFRTPTGARVWSFG